jgi:hypothetical protein
VTYYRSPRATVDRYDPFDSKKRREHPDFYRRVLSRLHLVGGRDHAPRRTAESRSNDYIVQQHGEMFRNGLSDSRIVFELGKKGTLTLDDAAQTLMNLANFYRLADKDPRYHTMSYSRGYGQPTHRIDRRTANTPNSNPPDTNPSPYTQTHPLIPLRLRTTVIKARATRTMGDLRMLLMLLMHPNTTPDEWYRIGSYRKLLASAAAKRDIIQRNAPIESVRRKIFDHIHAQDSASASASTSPWIRYRELVPAH